MADKFVNVGKCIAACKTLSKELGLSLPLPPRGMAFNVGYWNGIYANLEQVKEQGGFPATASIATAPPAQPVVKPPLTASPVVASKPKLELHGLERMAAGTVVAGLSHEQAAAQTKREPEKPLFGLARTAAATRVEH